MRPRLLLTFLLLTAIGAGTWGYLARRQLARQWKCYRVGAAETFDEARAEIVWFETGPDRDERLRELVGKWGTGNRRFDLHLARYVDDPQSSEALRKAFSIEFAWRPELLSRWAHYWSWRPGMEPNERVASITAYFDDLAAAGQAHEITWREVLDLQAMFQLTGSPKLALRLKPTNWPDRWRRWRDARPKNPPRLARPEQPLPD